MSSNNRNEQQQRQQQQQQHNLYQQQQQQQQQQRPLNPYSNSFTFNPSSLYYNNSDSNNNNFYYNPNAQAQHQSNSLNLYSNNNTDQALMNNYYQPQQQQQPQLYQSPQQQTYTQFQTYVPPQPTSLQPFNDPIVPTEPDEFILDLLKKPQERLFLLKLELEIEAFIKEESKLRLDFPGMNSYQRLMVHRLAPYFKLNHFHDAMRKAVYVCRTFITALPAVRLQDVRLDCSSKEPNNDTTDTPTTTQEEEGGNSGADQQPQPTPQFKIMRRSAGSSPNSRNTGETAENSKELNRKNMTFEERKTAYEEARARIFQNLESPSSSSASSPAATPTGK